VLWPTKREHHRAAVVESRGALPCPLFYGAAFAAMVQIVEPQAEPGRTYYLTVSVTEILQDVYLGRRFDLPGIIDGRQDDFARALASPAHGMR
jgi:hypothetical protein